MTRTAEQPKVDRIFRPTEAAAKLGIGRASLYRLVKIDLLPAPRKVGLRASGWLESELDAFLERQRLNTVRRVGEMAPQPCPAWSR
jgi:prophage regulatory protein